MSRSTLHLLTLVPTEQALFLGDGMSKRERRSRSTTRAGTQIFLFTDLVGSTRLFDSLGEDVADPLIRNHLRMLGWSVRKHGGEVVKSLGDGLMAVFTSAGAAIASGIEMQQVIHWQNVEAPERALGLRVGIHAGEATYDGVDYYGAAVWVARRICDVAGSGDIFVSDVFKRLLGTRGDHDLRRRDDIEAKGVTEAVPAWLVVWTPGAAPPDVSPPERGPAPRAVAAAAVIVVSAIVVASIVWITSGDDVGPNPPGSRTPRGSPNQEERETTQAVAQRPNTSLEVRSSEPALAGDKVVAFSTLDRLVRTDHDSYRDVYLSQRRDNPAILVSLPFGDRSSTGASGAPSISQDGTMVAFESTGDNLIPADGNGFTRDIFVYSVEDETVDLVSQRTNQRQAKGPSMAPSISANGDVVAFASDAGNLAQVGDHNGVRDVFRRDLRSGVTTRVSIGPGNREADGPSYSPSISGSGHFVAYASKASNLVSNDDNGVVDVFVYDTSAQETEIVSLDSDGETADQPSYQPAISREGDFVAFASEAALTDADTDDDLDVYLYDRDADELELISGGLEGSSSEPSISSKGDKVVFATEIDDESHVYMWERSTADVVMVDVDDDGDAVKGSSTSPALSPDGRFVAFVAPLKSFLPGLGGSLSGVLLRGPLS